MTLLGGADPRQKISRGNFGRVRAPCQASAELRETRSSGRLRRGNRRARHAAAHRWDDSRNPERSTSTHATTTTTRSTTHAYKYAAPVVGRRSWWIHTTPTRGLLRKTYLGRPGPAQRRLDQVPRLRGRLDLRPPFWWSVLKIVIKNHEVVRLLVVVCQSVMFFGERAASWGRRFVASHLASSLQPRASPRTV